MDKRIGTTALAAVLAAGALAGCGLDVGTDGSERSYQVTGTVKELSVGGTGNVEVIGTDDARVTVREKLRWSNRNNKPTTGHALHDGVLKITGRCGRTVLGVERCEVTHQVRVPRGLTVTVDSGDGSITATGLTGPVRLHSGTGAIAARDLRSPSLKATNDDGRINVSGQITTVELNAGTGRIDADRLRAEHVTARSGDGSISLVLLAPPADVRADTGTGSINVLLPNTAAYAVTSKVGTGSEHVDPALRRDDRSRHRVEVSSGDGKVRVSPA
ncbi:DUF4097 family beta strand repeat-containing protein [Spirillospora sp. CA-253888]